MIPITPIEFIEKNISTEPYEIARFSLLETSPKIKVDPEKISSSLIEKAKKDIQRFNDLERIGLSISHPQVGDAIQRNDGRLTFIGIFHYDGFFQDTESNRFYLGYYSRNFSGGFTMDVLNISNLLPTSTLTPIRAWFFSENCVGGNRGVNHAIHVKTWQEK